VLSCKTISCGLPADKLAPSHWQKPSNNTEIGRNLTQAARLTGRDFVVISRSDSTLRGHFPGEMSSLVKALDREDMSWLIIPCFFEGERYTIGDIHYVEEDGKLYPVGETAFAQDKVFKFGASNLRNWVEEKPEANLSWRGRIHFIELIRSGGPISDHICAG
jgi:uncharacterized protein YgbK (DUF1537 family)